VLYTFLNPLLLKSVFIRLIRVIQRSGRLSFVVFVASYNDARTDQLIKSTLRHFIHILVELGADPIDPAIRITSLLPLPDDNLVNDLNRPIINSVDAVFHS
jgi:hypothetical protein